MNHPDAAASAPHDFIRERVRADVAANKHGGRVVTRFPPEPNGFLHIGHAKSICLNFALAEEFGGRCHLRFDDTNPAAEDVAYVEAIQRDVRWLGFDWGEHLYFASDYYERLFELACELVRKGRAYVCDLSEAEASVYRGSISEAGRNSPFRDRSVEENLDLFRRMRAGEFAEGSRVLRAKIDMASPNMKMRDPNLYRIKRAHHYRTGDAWCIYPLYDYAHCLSDSFEGITHSICTMEFESARELYDWVIEATGVPHVPKQTEFARLNLAYTVMSKRKLLDLVVGKHVSGWDDPRMPTIAGMRRRGYSPESIVAFAKRVGVARNLSLVDPALLEHCVREDLNAKSPRMMAVLKPLPLVVENWPAGRVEELDAPLWPHDIPKDGSRSVPFSGELLIEESDFMADPPADFFRLAPGRRVRLRHAYVVTCTGFDRDGEGRVTRVRCTYDPETRGGSTPPGEKVSGTIHWVSAPHAVDVEARIYDRLFSVERPGEERDFREDMNPSSLVVQIAKGEPALASLKASERVQLERIGFFFVDPDSTPGHLVLNRTVALKDTWAKVVAKAAGEPARPARAREKAPAPSIADSPRAAALSPEAEALVGELSIGADEARVLAQEPALLALLRSAVDRGAPAAAAATWLANDVLGELRARKLREPPFGGADVAELLALTREGTLSSALAKDVLTAMLAGEGSPRAIVDARGLRQIDDRAALEAVVDGVLAAQEGMVARYRGGNANVLGALVGMAMKASGGKANPSLLRALLVEKLG